MRQRETSYYFVISWFRVSWNFRWHSGIRGRSAIFWENTGKWERKCGNRAIGARECPRCPRSRCVCHVYTGGIFLKDHRRNANVQDANEEGELRRDEKKGSGNFMPREIEIRKKNRTHTDESNTGRLRESRVCRAEKETARRGKNFRNTNLFNFITLHWPAHKQS